MTFKPTKVVVFLAALALLSSLSATQAWAADLDDLEHLAPLELIAGEGADSHQPGLAAQDQWRVYWFWSGESSCSRRAEPGISSLVEAFPDVEVIVVMSNVDESLAEAKQILADADLGVPVYRDEQARLARVLGATMTPEVVVVDDEEVRFQGLPVRVGRRGMNSFVEEALKALVAGEKPNREFVRPVGCPIRMP